MAEGVSNYKAVVCVNCGSSQGEHEVFVQTTVEHYGHLKGDDLTTVVCPRCGLVFLNPQPTREALDRFYRDEYYSKSPQIPDAVALKSQKRWQHDFLYTWLVKQIPEKIREWDILDVGSGYGVWLQWFEESNRMAGIESSKQASKIASDLFGIKVDQEDFLTNQLPDEVYDLVTGLAIIEHFNDPLAALVEMNRLLKNDGYLYLQTPDVHGMVLRQGTARYFKVVHTYYYSIETLSSLLLKAGFEIAASRCRRPLIDTSGFLFPENYWSGELDVLAVKREQRSLDEARRHPATSKDNGAVKASLKNAFERDGSFIRYAKVYRMKGIRIPFKMLFKLVKWLKVPRSIFEVQADVLDLDL